MNNKRKICFLICRTLQNRNTKSHWFITDKKKVFFHRHKCFMCPRLKIYYIGDNKTLNSIKNSKKSQQNGVFEPFFFGFPTRERRLFRKAPDCEKTKKTPWWFTWLYAKVFRNHWLRLFFILFSPEGRSKQIIVQDMAIMLELVYSFALWKRYDEFTYFFFLRIKQYKGIDIIEFRLDVSEDGSRKK